jgi:hypothetical protein
MDLSIHQKISTLNSKTWFTGLTAFRERLRQRYCLVACRNGVISIDVFEGILIRGLTNKSAWDLRMVRTRWSDRSFDRMGEDLRSLSLICQRSPLSLTNPLNESDVRFGNKSLHTKLAKSPKHQESVLNKQLFRGDRPTHGIQTPFSLFSTFDWWWSVHVGGIESFAVRYVDWNIWFSELSRRAILANISGEGWDIVVWVWSCERVTEY